MSPNQIRVKIKKEREIANPSSYHKQMETGPEDLKENFHAHCVFHGLLTACKYVRKSIERYF